MTTLRASACFSESRSSEVARSPPRAPRAADAGLFLALPHHVTSPVVLSPQSTSAHKALPGHVATEGLGEPAAMEPDAAALTCPDRPWGTGDPSPRAACYPLLPAACRRPFTLVHVSGTAFQLATSSFIIFHTRLGPNPGISKAPPRCLVNGVRLRRARLDVGGGGRRGEIPALH